MENELKNCPFCGGKARCTFGKYNLLGAYGTTEEERRWYGVRCSRCGVTQQKRKYHTREEANEAWNGRVE